MTWVLIGVIAWLVVGLAVAVLIGRAVRTADRREQGGRRPAAEDAEQAHGDEHGSAASFSVPRLAVPRLAVPRVAALGPRSALIRH
jgi:uncharacterized iron-regulated membrane protein